MQYCLGGDVARAQMIASCDTHVSNTNIKNEHTGNLNTDKENTEKEIITQKCKYEKDVITNGKALIMKAFFNIKGEWENTL